MVGWGEGLDIVTDYLNKKPDAERMTVAGFYPRVMSAQFKGTVLSDKQYDAAMADYIVLLDHGRTTAAGTANELKARIGDQRVDVIAADLAGMERLVEMLSTRFDVTPSPEQRMISIPAPHDVADLARVSEALTGVGVEIDEVALRRTTLDDAFLAFTEPAIWIAPEKVASEIISRSRRRGTALPFRR